MKVTNPRNPFLSRWPDNWHADYWYADNWHADNWHGGHLACGKIGMEDN